jgi:hypothetical protein
MAIATLLSLPSLAHADDACRASGTSVGRSCTTAGPDRNQAGICETVACSADGGAANPGDGGPCVACLVDGTAGGCGGGRPVDSTKASFTPTVGGCCSVAGTSPWQTGAGLASVTLGLGLAFLQRRRARR